MSDPASGLSGHTDAEPVTDHRKPLRCLGTTKDGSPRHPLYVPSSAQLRPWPEVR